jgi:Pyruvate/2-oxoacid:ferredoxin oxidoreductase delta subunit
MIKEGNRGVKLVCQRLAPGPKEAAGRRRPVPTGETFEVPFSALIQGQVQEPDYADPVARLGIERGRKPLNGKIKLDMPGLFAAADANKLGHVTVAIAQGRLAAEAIDAEHSGKPQEEEEGKQELPLIGKDKLKLEWYKEAARREQGAIPVAERFNGASDREVNTGFSREDCIEEAKRCMSCGMCMDCDNCWMYCQDQAVDKLSKELPVGQHYQYKHELCTGCEKCAEECPCGYLKMV